MVVEVKWAFYRLTLCIETVFLLANSYLLEKAIYSLF